MVRTWKNRISDEAGASMIVVALSLVVLFGFAALAIDGGFLLVERRLAQNAADNAVLAGAWAGCSSSEAAGNTAAEASVVKNGYTAPELSFFQHAAPDDDLWEAQVTTSVDHKFAPLIGFSSSGVAAKAQAICVPGGGAGTIETGIWAYYWFRTAPEDGPTIGTEPEYFGSVFANGYGCASFPCGNINDPTDPYSFTNGYSLFNTITNVPWVGTIACTSVPPAPATPCHSGFGTNQPSSGIQEATQSNGLPINLSFSMYADPAGGPTGARAGDAYWGPVGTDNYTYVELGGSGTWDVNCNSLTDGAYAVNGNLHLTGNCGNYQTPDFGETLDPNAGTYRNLSFFANGWIQVEDQSIKAFSNPAWGANPKETIVLASWSSASPWSPSPGGGEYNNGHLDEFCGVHPWEEPSSNTGRDSAICHHSEGNAFIGLEYAPNGHCRHADDDNFLYGAAVCAAMTAIPEESGIGFGAEFVAPYQANQVYIHGN